MSPGTFVLLLVACALGALIAGNYPAFFALAGWFASLCACRCHLWWGKRR